MFNRKMFLITLVLAFAMLLGACRPDGPDVTQAPPPTQTSASGQPENTPVPNTPTQANPQPEPTVTTAPENPTATQAAVTPKTTLTIWHSFNEKETQALNQLIMAYQAANPGVQFDVLYTPVNDLRGRFEQAATGTSGPTILLAPADWGLAYYDADLVQDLTSLFADVVPQLNEAAVSTARYSNALVGLPYTVKGVVLYRNSSIIDAAPTTFADLLSKAQAATQGEEIFGASLERGFYFAAAHLHAQGGQLMDEEGYPAFNNEAGVAWMQMLKDFADAGPTSYYTDQDLTRFRDGKAGMMIDLTMNLSSLQASLGENLVIDPWPQGMSGYVQTDHMYLSARAEGETVSAAVAFMNFVVSPEGQAFLAGGGLIPVNPNTQVNNSLINQAAAALAGGVPYPLAPELAGYWGSMDAALAAVYNNELPIQDAINGAIETITNAVNNIKGK